MPKKTHGPALTWSQSNQFHHVFTKLRERALMHLRHGVTAQDIFDAFVKDKDKDPIKRVMKICDVNVEHQAIDFPTTCDIEANNVKIHANVVLGIGLSTETKFKFLFPKYMAKGQLLNMTPKLARMIELLTSIHFEWAQVYQVFNHLNEVCISPRELATLMPWLGVAAAELEECKELGERLKNYSHTIDTPALPRELRLFALSLERTIAKAQLTPADTDKEEDEVEIMLKSGDTNAKRWDGETWLVKF